MKHTDKKIEQTAHACPSCSDSTLSAEAEKTVPVPHKHGNSHAHSHGFGGHGSAQMFLKRFWIVTALLVPLLFTNAFIAGLMGVGLIRGASYIGFGIATIIFGFSLIFFKHAWHEIKSRNYGMMTLVSLAVGSGYLFSVVSTFVPAFKGDFYLEIATLIWVLLFGHYLEAKSTSAAGNALQEVAKLLPKEAHKIVDGTEIETSVSELQKGDIVLVKPGEKIPADGIVMSGSANVNESLISGESKPVRRSESDTVVAGSICIDGSLTVALSRVGDDSTIGQIKKLIESAQNTKPSSQKIADKASAVLTFTAAIVAILTVLVWSVFLGQPFVFAITLAITVLVIACPHALGLAIPTVTTISTSLAVKSGVFIKDMSKIEIIRKADYVVFDKTGTLTKGTFGVTDISIIEKEYSEKKILTIAASLEQHSAHIIGQSIVLHAKNNDVALENPKNFSDIAGKGIEGELSDSVYFVGNKALLMEKNITLSTEANEKLKVISVQGKTPVLIATAEKIIGILALSDEIKKESYDAIKSIHALGVKVAMLTGDTEAVAKGVADELGIDTYFAEVVPEDKYRHIKELQKDGSVVLMVGDGVNDAPALTQADVGIAIGAGTDIAIEAGDVVLMNNNPQDIKKLLILSRKVYSKMIQNLVWALGYNIVAIPAAAGVFAVWGIFLRPEVGALLMALSTVLVVANAMLLKRIDLS